MEFLGGPHVLVERVRRQHPALCFHLILHLLSRPLEAVLIALVSGDQTAFDQLRNGACLDVVAEWKLICHPVTQLLAETRYEWRGSRPLQPTVEALA